MTLQSTHISCPKCGHEFAVEDVISKQLEEKYRSDLNQAITKIENDFKTKEGKLSTLEADLKKQQQAIDDTVNQKLKILSDVQAKDIQQKVAQQFEETIKSLTEETTETKKQLSELKKTKIENEQLKRKLDEQKQDLEVIYEQKMTETLKAETDNIRKRESERVEMKLKEKDETINAMKSQMDEMKRRAEQGSMQLQGEVQELLLEEVLTGMFPYDTISEVPKGVRGADVILTVRNRSGQDCGVIAFESKRTKAFSNEWITKLKADAVLVKADICVLVSEVLPDGIDRIGQVNGVWVVSYNDYKGLVVVLRDSLIRIAEAYGSQTNKGEKMSMLYDYLMSNEFRLQVGAIVDGFTSLQKSYNREKDAMMRIWKEREKQLQQVLLNTNHFIGSIKGIAGSSIGELKQIQSGVELLEGLVEPDDIS